MAEHRAHVRRGVAHGHDQLLDHLVGQIDRRARDAESDRDLALGIADRRGDRAHAVADLIADYIENIERYAVFRPVEPGSLRPLFPADPPETSEPIDAILADYDRLVVPNATQWQHPGFMAYFATTASGPGILGEMLTAAIGQNPMLWRTSPIGTELEEVVVEYPIGHKRRRKEGMPILVEKFRTNLARRFPPKQQKAILELCMDAGRLAATPVNEFVDLFVI